MVKIIMEIDIDVKDLQKGIEEDQESEEYDFPVDAEETTETLSNMYLADFTELIDGNEGDSFKVTELQFKSKAEKEKFEKWLKKKGKDEDSDDDDDDDEELIGDLDDEEE
jgi:hypothetical protein